MPVIAHGDPDALDATAGRIEHASRGVRKRRGNRRVVASDNAGTPRAVVDDPVISCRFVDRRSTDYLASITLEQFDDVASVRLAPDHLAELGRRVGIVQQCAEQIDRCVRTSKQCDAGGKPFSNGAAECPLTPVF